MATTETIQPHEIVGYLPYVLKMIFEKSGRIITLTGVIEHKDGLIYVNEYGIEWSSDVWRFKPILRSLESMTEDEQLEHKVLYYQNMYRNDIVNLMQWYYSHHFDLHNLIPRSLAIDINSLK